MDNYLVLDAGGTFIKYAIMNEQAEILEKGKKVTPSYKEHTLEDYLDTLDQIVLPYKEKVSGIAVSMPGILNGDTGYCTSAGFLMYCAGENMKEILEQRYALPVTIENDGKCGALAESWRGSLKGIENGAVIIIGTGMAGGLILNGKLYRGNHFSAGEYSFLSINALDCMNKDTFWGMDNGVPGLIKRVIKETGWEEESLDGIKVFEEANKGNQAVLKALDEYTLALAVQIYNLNILLDLDKVSIGGGISKQPILHRYLQKNYDWYVEHSPMAEYNPNLPKTQLVNCKYYNDANLIGALYHFFQKQKKEAV